MRDRQDTFRFASFKSVPEGPQGPAALFRTGKRFGCGCQKEREKSNSCFSLRFFAPTDNESIKVQGGGGDMNPSPSASARHGSAHQQTAKLGSVGWGRPCENSFLYGSVRSRLLHRVSGLLRVLPCRRCPKWRIMLKLWAETCLSDGTGRCRREHIDGTLRAALKHQRVNGQP